MKRAGLAFALRRQSRPVSTSLGAAPTPAIATRMLLGLAHLGVAPWRMPENTVTRPEVDVPAALLKAARSARRITVLTGAGMSAESGIPTFRDALTGLWSTFNPQDLATRQGFVRDPALVWGWYEARREGVARAQPNAGHRALSELATRQGLEDLTIVTQNVDDLHERAGSRQVIHLHGSLFAPRCLDCGHPASTHAMGLPTASRRAEDGAQPPPRCSVCGGPVRPGVVWFGEELPRAEWNLACERTSRADLLLVVGTSGLVYPAAGLPDLAMRAGAAVWDINPEAPIAKGCHPWRCTAATGLPALISRCLDDAA
ncbi:MAG: SIR2 family NAD-dependent protein deacylase [Rhizobacter sp.]